MKITPKDLFFLAITFLAFFGQSLTNTEISVSVVLTATEKVSYKTYPDPDKMLSKIQVIDLDRIDWVPPNSLLSLQKSSQDLQSLKQVVDNIKFFTKFLTKLGPWTVTCKDPHLVPDGDVHQYYSWARYSWPVNSSHTSTDTVPTPVKKRESVNFQPNIVGVNQPQTTPDNGTSSNYSFPDYCAKPDDVPYKMSVWQNCPYENRDGESNPDILLLGDPIAFRSSCRAAFLNAVMFGLTGEGSYGEHAAYLIRYFFLNPETAVRPQLKYGQIVRGPARPGSDNDYTKGTFRAIIDWRHLIKAINAVIIMRGTRCSPWTAEDDVGMRQWAKDYFTWLLEDQTVSFVARNKTNNIMSWWYSQAIALNILLEDTQTASLMIDQYFQGPFMNLIDGNGDQPKESNRTRSVHYRAFGIEAMLVNLRMAAFIGKNEWNAKANISSTLNDGVLFSVFLANKNSTLEEKAELAPHVASALAIYGDTANQDYTQYLKNNQAYGDVHQNATWHIFNLPSFFDLVAPSINQSLST